jgi:hypothetical protein
VKERIEDNKRILPPLLHASKLLAFRFKLNFKESVNRNFPRMRILLYEQRFGPEKGILPSV